MHLNLTKTALICATVAIFGYAFGQEPTKVTPWEEMTPVQRADAEKALEQKLEAQVKPAAEKAPADDPTLTPRERAIKIRAREIELREELKKLESAKRKLDTPNEKKAWKQIEREEKAERNAQREELRKVGNAELSGCAPDSVWVSRRATERTMWRVMTLVRITNTSALPINIESPLYGGDLVRNLCSGGSVTLSFVIAWTDADQLQIPLTAVARPDDGGILTDQFQTYLSRWNVQSQRVTTQVWQARPYRQHLTR